MTPRIAASVLLAAGASLAACVHKYPQEVRMDAIRRAQVWTKTDVSAMDIKAGPKGEGAFAPDATVTCEYVDKKMTGRSPKFTCKIPPDDEVKVKFGPDNGEVYGEVAASRLFWALGFGADRMYPVKVVCKGCPPNIVGTEVAVIERKLPGREIESDIETGWAFRELDLIDSDKGGATRAERDALKLLAVFLQHTDSKAIQQRLLCLDPETDGKSGKGAEAGANSNGNSSGGGKDKSADKSCEESFMFVQDVGLTFGHATKFNGTGTESVSLVDWAATPIWKDPDRCIANMRKSSTGTLKDPRISEEGRKFLADLMVQLTDQQLRDLFEVARFSRRPALAGRPGSAATTQQWVDAFKKKRSEIVNRVCPS
jgi:hypothetical protein